MSTKPWLVSKENYYSVLEICTPNVYHVELIEIKKSYRRLALLYHPDKGHKAADVLFQRLQEAYEVLTDNAQRKDYHGWYRSRFKTTSVSQDALDKEIQKRQKIVDQFLSEDEKQRLKEQKEEELRKEAERAAAVKREKQRRAREKARQERIREAERLKKLEEKRKREEEVLEKRRQEEKARAEERIRNMKREEELLKQERYKARAKHGNEHLSKTEYFDKLSKLQNESTAMAEERNKLTEESERLAKKATLIRNSAENAFAKAKLKYEREMEKSKLQFEKALALDLESDAIHENLLDALDQYEELTSIYTEKYGVPDDEVDEEDEDSDTDDDIVKDEIPSTFNKKDTSTSASSTSPRPLSANEYVQKYGSPLNKGNGYTETSPLKFNWTANSDSSKSPNSSNLNTNVSSPNTAKSNTTRRHASGVKHRTTRRTQQRTTTQSHFTFDTPSILVNNSQNSSTPQISEPSSAESASAKSPLFGNTSDISHPDTSTTKSTTSSTFSFGTTATAFASTKTAMPFSFTSNSTESGFKSSFSNSAQPAFGMNFTFSS